MSKRERDDLRRRFLRQADRSYNPREYPDGRISADDDGLLATAVAVDHRHKVIVLNFGQPVAWIGLNADTARGLIDLLSQKLKELEEGPG